MRSALTFDVGENACAATLDAADGSHGLLIVSGGNEIRCGAHRGMARLAAVVAAAGSPVFRFDRRGVGDSEGNNAGFEGSGADIAAAAAAFRAAAPQIDRVTAYGNCDAAAALLLSGGAHVDAMVLANPWTIDTANETIGADTLPPPAAIRARYLAKLRRPSEWGRLLRGRVDFAKLRRGLAAAHAPSPPQRLAARVMGALDAFDGPIRLLIAERDMTAMAFMQQWPNVDADCKRRVNLERLDSVSHSFADVTARDWLQTQILEALAER